MKRLVKLDLSYNKLEGALHPCLGNLTSLQIVDLSGNQLSGNISATMFSSLTSLGYLSLSGNYFGGLFVLNLLANHSKLEVLMLAMRGNKFQVEIESNSWVPTFQLKVLHMPNCSTNSWKRTIPSFLFYQHALENIDLSWNQLVGVFPNCLLHNNSQLQMIKMTGNSFTGFANLFMNSSNHMFKLNLLDISRNQFGGQLPQDIGHILPNVRALYMSHNSFQGQIPSSFGDIPDLQILDLDNNNFSGEAPRQLLSHCSSLYVLKLSKNSLHGKLFSNYWYMPYLSLLSLKNNYFTGVMQVGNFDLRSLDVSNNQFSGTLTNFYTPPNLIVLSMFGNNFEGEIPQQWCKLDQLEYINLSRNRLSGYIPSCFNEIPLKFIHLQGNNLTGSIPETFSSKSELVTLDLRDNNLSGNVPNWIHQLSNLKVVLLARNHFEGQLPFQLCQLKNLSFLDLSHNSLTGPIPPCLSDISFGSSKTNGITSYTLPMCFGFDDSTFMALATCQDYSFNILPLSTFKVEEVEIVEFTTKGVTLSYEGTILDYMSGLDLSSNGLSGQIPDQLGNLLGLHALNLSRNSFDGTIPASLSQLQNVESLDLSYNNLSGRIPSQLVELNTLAIFNVSYNNLSGVTPSEGQFATFDESCYIGNPKLHWVSCGSQERRHCYSTTKS